MTPQPRLERVPALGVALQRRFVPSFASMTSSVCRGEDPGEHPVTISIGLAHIEEHDTIGMALGKADQALYQAKRTGKDRFVLWAQ